MFVSELKAIQIVIRGWAARVFPERSRLPVDEQVAQAIRKLKKEVEELEQNSTGEDEFADVAIILFDIAEMRGHDIQEAVIKKMAINYQRKWQLEGDGTYQHIKEDHA
jgi:hypothetical protein